MCTNNINTITLTKIITTDKVYSNLKYSIEILIDRSMRQYAIFTAVLDLTDKLGKNKEIVINDTYFPINGYNDVIDELFNKEKVKAFINNIHKKVDNFYKILDKYHNKEEYFIEELNRNQIVQKYFTNTNKERKTI